MDNNRDFLDGLSQTLTRTARSLGDRLNQELETSKLHGRIATEEKAIEQLKADIGSLIYSRYDAGEVYDGELGRLCLTISEHYGKIRRLEGEYARFRGKKICAACGKEIGTESLFCPFCGVACPAPEPEPKAKEEESAEEEKVVSFEDYQKGEEAPFGEETAPEEGGPEAKENPGEENPEGNDPGEE